MEQTRIQVLNGETTLETTTTEPVKEKVTLTTLLRNKTYFEEMIALGQAGLVKVNTRLTQINDAKAK